MTVPLELKLSLLNRPSLRIVISHNCYEVMCVIYPNAYFDALALCIGDKIRLHLFSCSLTW